jgi:HK97 family phage portal protein
MTDIDIFGDEIVEKSQVSIAPPSVQFSLLRGAKAPGRTFDTTRRDDGKEHYEMYRQHPVVRAAIDKKAQFAVAAGWTFKSTRSVELLDQAKKQRLESFFRKSNPKQLMRMAFKDLDIYGEAFWLIVRSASKQRTPIKALRLNPRYMTEVLDKAGYLVSWEYGPVTTSEDPIPYELDEIVQFKLDDPENDVRGLSPLYSLERAVAQDLYAMEYNQRFFENSAQTGIIFIVKTSTGDETKRNREWIEQNYVGSNNAHKPLLIEGDVAVERSVAKNAEMEFLEGRKLLRSEILMVLEMDPDKVGIHDNSNRSTARETGESFSAETIWPRQGIVEEEINNALILNVFRWDDIVFQFMEGDPRRKQDLADTRDKDLKSGRETINQQLEAMGHPKVEGGDDPFIMTPQGIILVKHLEALSQATVDKAQADAAPPPVPTSSGGIQATPKTPPLTAKQAVDVSQKANG